MCSRVQVRGCAHARFAACFLPSACVHSISKRDVLFVDPARAPGCRYGFAPVPIVHGDSAATLRISWAFLLQFCDKVSAGVSAAQGGWGPGRPATSAPLSFESAMAKREILAALVAESCLHEDQGDDREGGGNAGVAVITVRLGAPPVRGQGSDSRAWKGGEVLLLSLGRLILASCEVCILICLFVCVCICVCVCVCVRLYVSTLSFPTA